MKQSCWRAQRTKIIALPDVHSQHTHPDRLPGTKNMIFILKSSSDELTKGIVAVETRISVLEDQIGKNITTRAEPQRPKNQGQKDFRRTDPPPKT